MKSLFSLILGLFLLSTSVFAQEDSPDALIKKVTEDVLTIVRQDRLRHTPVARALHKYAMIGAGHSGRRDR